MPNSQSIMLFNAQTYYIVAIIGMLEVVLCKFSFTWASLPFGNGNYNSRSQFRKKLTIESNQSLNLRMILKLKIYQNQPKQFKFFQIILPIFKYMEKWRCRIFMKTTCQLVVRNNFKDSTPYFLIWCSNQLASWSSRKISVNGFGFSDWEILQLIPNHKFKYRIFSHMWKWKIC